MTATTRTLLALAALSLALVAASGAASAHASRTVGDGSIKITWGWTSEPTTTMKVNGLDLIIRDNATNAGIGDLQGNLTVMLHKGEQELEIESLTTQFGKGPGNYTGSAPITPTEPGLYVLHVKGTIRGQEIDVEIPASHEVEAIEETYFPAKDATGGDDGRIAALEQRIAALEAKVQTQAETPATVTSQPSGPSEVPGPGLLLVAAGVVGVALLLRRRS